MKKLDAHAHVGTFGGWANVAITAEELVQQMDACEIEKTVLCSTGSDDNFRTKEAMEAYPHRFWGLVYANPLEGEKSVQEIYDLVQNEGFSGIKLNPLRHAYVADAECLDPIMEAARELHIPVFIHSGHAPYALPWSIALLAERFPDVNIVMIHMGHGHGVYIDAALKMARRYSNLYLEMSGMPMNSKIKEAYETVGSDRIFFGTDAPFHHPTIEMQKVITSGLPEKEIEDVFYNNLQKFMAQYEK